jgi:bifunctional DNA-binding transcriptional regulator/antitoxin component of YhaV-PrlF toxin-antitoxin module
MSVDIAKMLAIEQENVKVVNDYLTDPGSRVVKDFFDVVEKYGGVEEIEKKAAEAGRLEVRLEKLAELKSPYLTNIEWLKEQVESGAFISITDYRSKVLGEKAGTMTFADDYAVTLEISAAQFFPYVIAQAKQAIANSELMPGRFIRVRGMKEQEADNGDLVAFGAAMNILGASYVETLDTKGTDGSNIHLGGPETITGYFGGVGQPNDHAIMWLDEFLHYYTNYGVRQVLNINPGTVLLGYFLRKIGVQNEFKISVYMGNDNPYGVLWTLMTARLLADPRGGTSLIGFNFANSVNNETILISDEIRRAMGLEDIVRFEHHILETYKSIVIQPYDRRDELLEIADKVKNISAKHEGGEIEIEKTREHPTDILDYFLPKEEILKQEGLWEYLQTNYLDKHEAVNITAQQLTEKGCSFIAAHNAHKP